MSIPPVDRLKVWLGQTDLRQKNFALYQLLNGLIDAARQGQIETTIAASSGGGSPNAITSLTTDVVAIGPGAAVATIQPSVVTYSKIQNVVNSDRLLGREIGPGIVQEIGLGANLDIVGGTLQINTSGGGTGGGLAHNLLSATHPDTLPASPIVGDLIRAIPGPAIEGDYYGFYLKAPLVENFSGIRFGYTAGYLGTWTPSNSWGYSVSNLAFISPPAIKNFLAWEYIDFFLLALLVENFSGIRFGYLLPIYVDGNNAAYKAFSGSFIVPPLPTNPASAVLWTRLPKGAEDEVLTIIAGEPQWEPISSFPDQSWINITFNAGDFTATGGITPGWTVAGSNVERWQKQFSFDELGIAIAVRYALYLRTTSVTGTAPTQLHIAIPDTIAGRFAIFTSMQENSLAVNDTYVEYNAGVSSIELTIQKIGGGVFDTTAGETYLAFEISAVLA